jgi:hypothetical protein
MPKMQRGMRSFNQYTHESLIAEVLSRTTRSTRTKAADRAILWVLGARVRRSKKQKQRVAVSAGSFRVVSVVSDKTSALVA